MDKQNDFLHHTENILIRNPASFLYLIYHVVHHGQIEYYIEINSVIYNQLIIGQHQKYVLVIIDL